jgi:hypothetical protein
MPVEDVASRGDFGGLEGVEELSHDKISKRYI